MNSKDVENIFEKISKTKDKEKEKLYISELQKICDEIYDKYAKLCGKYDSNVIILPELKTFVIENLNYKVLSIDGDKILCELENNRIWRIDKKYLIDLIEGYGYAENDMMNRHKCILRMKKGKHIAEIADLKKKIKNLNDAIEYIDMELIELDS